MAITPVDTSSFTPAQLSAFNTANALGSGVPTISHPAPAPTPAPAPATPAPTSSAATYSPAPAPTPAPTPANNGIQTARENNGTYTGYDGVTQYYKYDNTPVTSTTAAKDTQNGTTNTDTTLADPTDRAALAQAQADYQAQAKQVQDTITGIQNGAIPLNSSEQAQIDGLKQQFQTLIDQQNQQNTGAFGTAQLRGYQSGAAVYDPTFQAKTIGAIVSAGAAKVTDLQIKEASAVANLTESIKNNDIKSVQDAWSVYQDAAKARQDALQKTITDTQDAIKAATDAKQKQDAYNLDVAKFNQTQDQNAFDNAFKAEQQKFAESQASETARHNKVTESIDAFKAGMGAGNGDNGLGITKSAELSPAGSPDPVSQKQVYDQMVSQYGPMTALAIQSLANYSMNPTDWSTRMVKGGQGMTREQAVTLAKMYDPTYNDAMYNVRATYMKSIASTNTGTVGGAVNSANKAINHLTSFATTMNQIQSGPGGSSPFTTVNAAINNTVGRLNYDRTAALGRAQTEGLGVADELAKFFKGTGSTDVQSIDSWKNAVSSNASPADLHGSVQGAIDLLNGQLQVLSEQYATTMGKAPTNNFLSPSAMASLSSLKNQGYTVDIPGVLYTDKDAYLKNDPSAQENMTTAMKQLQTAGLPLTPENILQMAQSQ